MAKTTTIAVPTSRAALCAKLVELPNVSRTSSPRRQWWCDRLRALEQCVADALGEVERGLHAQVLARLDFSIDGQMILDFRVSSISLDAFLETHARVAAIDLQIVAKTRQRAICQRFRA